MSKRIEGQAGMPQKRNRRASVFRTSIRARDERKFYADVGNEPITLETTHNADQLDPGYLQWVDARADLEWERAGSPGVCHA